MLAPLLKGQHVVWGGPLGYRDLPLFRTSGRSSSAIGSPPCPASRPSTRGSREVPVDADISSLKLPIVGAAPLPPAVASAFEARTGVALCEGYGLTEGTCASALSWPDAPRAGHGRAAPALPAGARRRDRRGHRRVDVPARRRGRDARPPRPEHLRRLPRRRRLRARSCAPTARSRTAGSTPATWRRSTRTGSSGWPGAPRT